MKGENQKYIVDVSRFLLIFVGVDVFFASVLFIFNVSINGLNLFICWGISTVIYFLISNHEIRRKCIVIAVSCICLFVFVLSIGLIYEIAYDGNMYHKFAVGILKMGYNPVYEKVEEYLIRLNIPEQSWNNDQIWVSCYPKASWCFDATIYAVTNWIESAKLFNLIIFISSFGICYDYFSYKLQKRFASMITFLLIATPTSVSMLPTFYLDGALGNLLITSIVLLMSVTDDAYKGNKRLQFMYLGICIVLCGNLKITGLAYEGIFCFSFFVMWLIHLIKKDNHKMKIKKIRGIILYYICIVCVTVCVVGYGTYITNIINYGDLFYPLGKLEGFDINNNLKSVRMEYMSPLIQMLSMIFVKTNINDTLPYLEWKIPFSFELSEIRSSVYDVIRGGTGFIYSGILCIAVIMFLVWNWKFRKKNDINKKMVYLIMIISFGLICVVPAGGQTRYAPYIFYFVSFTIYLWMLEIQTGSLKNEILKKMPYVMFVLLLINLTPFIIGLSKRTFERTIDAKTQFEVIKQKGGAYIDTELPGLVFNFIDRNIEYVYDVESKLEDGTMYYYFLDYNYMNQ